MSYPNEGSYICVYFSKDNSYTVVEDINNKCKNTTFVKINFQGKWLKGIIKARGKTFCKT